jgi:hypothetical protein
VPEVGVAPIFFLSYPPFDWVLRMIDYLLSNISKASIIPVKPKMTLGQNAGVEEELAFQTHHEDLTLASFGSKLDYKLRNLILMLIWILMKLKHLNHPLVSYNMCSKSLWPCTMKARKFSGLLSVNL